MANTRRSGTDGVAARNTSTWNSPVWSAVATAEDIDLSLELQTYDSSDRTTVIDTEMGKRYKVMAKFSILWDPGNADHVAMWNAFTGTATGVPTGIEMVIMDGSPSVTGNRGVRAEWLITKFPYAMKLKDGMKIDLELSPWGGYTNAPVFFTT